MGLLKKLKETTISVIPIMAIMLLLTFTVAPVHSNLLARFLIGGVLLIIGLALFLQGVEIGIQPIGELIGAALTSKRKLFLLLVSAFAIGFLVTIAEPDIQVFGDQIHNTFNNVEKIKIILTIGLGVGLFLMFGLLRTILNVPLKIICLIFYTSLFAIAFISPSPFIGIAFDSGGATTGPMTVPFVMAIGFGVSSVRANSKASTYSESNDDNDFGLTGITSIGPILAVLICSIIFYANSNLCDSKQSAETLSSVEGISIFLEIFPEILKESISSIIPLIILLVLFQVSLLKLPPIRLARICFGLVWSFFGLTIFLIGVNGGFTQAGYQLGLTLGEKACSFGNWWIILLVSSGLLIGAIVVCAEPAVWVLTEQVENLSNGTIKRRIMLIFLAIGAAIAIGLAILRSVYNFSLLSLLIPGYSIAMILMIFSPPHFTAIAIDSGGVASGPITSTFVLSLTLGVAEAASHGNDIFGVIALVAMMPLISIQILGIIYKIVQRRQKNCLSK